MTLKSSPMPGSTKKFCPEIVTVSPGSAVAGDTAETMGSPTAVTSCAFGESLSAMVTSTACRPAEEATLAKEMFEQRISKGDTSVTIGQVSPATVTSSTLSGSVPKLKPLIVKFRDCMPANASSGETLVTMGES